ncbi:hypothetical protein BC831DRAFT_26333 [Entophlyctis helioformis]|nr:hypothetical protein BC831DRAFT_26333 [Entophlyctis helioformis]
MIASFFVTLLAASALAAPTTIVRRAPSFAEIDISQTPGNGDAALAAAKSVCSDNLSAKELKDLGATAEAAENTVFAVESLSGAKKAAVQCQRDRNKDNKADQIALNQKQVAKNTGDVTNRCANVDTSLFVGSGKAGGGAAKPPADKPKADKPAKEDKPKADKPAKGDKPAAVGFASIDISKTSGGGDAALAAANAKCPSSLGAAAIKAIARAAETAEKQVFNAAIAGKSGAAKDAIQCQKNRNKVLKNQCSLVVAQLENDAAQIAENGKQVPKNMAAVDDVCPGVDTSLFV